jgi:hypothetical protein
MVLFMGTHIQRKRFDLIDQAHKQAAELNHVRWTLPLVKLHAVAAEDGEGAWVVLTQTGDIVTGEEPCLPGYERVA